MSGRVLNTPLASAFQRAFSEEHPWITYIIFHSQTAVIIKVTRGNKYLIKDIIYMITYLYQQVLATYVDIAMRNCQLQPEVRCLHSILNATLLSFFIEILLKTLRNFTKQC